MIKRITLLFLSVFILIPNIASAELRVVVDSGTPNPLPIAVNSFKGNDANSIQMGRQIAQVIENDLTRSGLFRAIPEQSFIQRGIGQNETPRFADWRLINAQAMVHGGITANLSQITLEFRLWDVYAGTQMVGRRFTTSAANWRQLAHMVADAVYSRVTGEDGYFNTRVVYIAETGPATQRVKRLAVMDQDGANNRYLTDGRFLTLTPRFSPTSQEITYMSYESGQPSVYIYNLSTNRRQLLGRFPGMTFAPRFSPDGHKVVMSMAKGGNTDIYTMDLSSRRLTRLTDNFAIDTAPSFAPDGDRVAFESDRGGTQQLYVMNSDGSGAKRITFGDGRYANPVWSPRGDLIAFTKMKGGQFYIGVIRPDGSGERLVTQAYLVEGPTWAPNGRVLMYYKETPAGRSGTGRSDKIYSVDITGMNERLLTTPTDGSDPAWSPLLN